MRLMLVLALPACAAMQVHVVPARIATPEAARFQIVTVRTQVGQSDWYAFDSIDSLVLEAGGAAVTVPTVESRPAHALVVRQHADLPLRAGPLHVKAIATRRESTLVSGLGIVRHQVGCAILGLASTSCAQLDEASLREELQANVGADLVVPEDVAAFVILPAEGQIAIADLDAAGRPVVGGVVWEGSSVVVERRASNALDDGAGEALRVALVALGTSVDPTEALATLGQAKALSAADVARFEEALRGVARARTGKTLEDRLAGAEAMRSGIAELCRRSEDARGQVCGELRGTLDAVAAPLATALGADERVRAASKALRIAIASGGVEAVGAALAGVRLALDDAAKDVAPASVETEFPTTFRAAQEAQASAENALGRAFEDELARAAAIAQVPPAYLAQPAPKVMAECTAAKVETLRTATDGLRTRLAGFAIYDGSTTARTRRDEVLGGLASAVDTCGETLALQALLKEREVLATRIGGWIETASSCADPQVHASMAVQREALGTAVGAPYVRDARLDRLGLQRIVMELRVLHERVGRLVDACLPAVALELPPNG